MLYLKFAQGVSLILTPLPLLTALTFLSIHLDTAGPPGGNACTDLLRVAGARPPIWCGSSSTSPTAA